MEGARAHLASGVPCAACLKHWVADGGTAIGTGGDNFAWTGAPARVLDQGDTRVEEAELEEERRRPPPTTRR